MAAQPHVMTPLRVAIIVATIATALTHISLLFPDVVFILNGLGYLVLLGMLYLPIPQLERFRPLIRWVLIGYTALTIGLWLAFGSRTPVGFVNKANELVLIVLLLLEARQSRHKA